MNSRKKSTPDRTEEMQAIIERMPVTFGKWITLLVVSFTLVLVSIGWWIKYPDIITGSIRINAENAPVKLVANTSGRIDINGFKSLDEVQADDYIAVISNGAAFHDVIRIKGILDSLNMNELISVSSLIAFPTNVSLGELNGAYFQFIQAYKQFIEFHQDDIMAEQILILGKMLKEQQYVFRITGERLNINDEGKLLLSEAFKRDSILYEQKAVSRIELEKSRIQLLSSQDNYHSILSSMSTIRENIEETSSKIQQTSIQRKETQRQVLHELISAHTSLIGLIKEWENKFVLKAGINGQVQFLKFFHKGQFVQQGEPVFTIVPPKSKVKGQMLLPASGAGKAQVGQEVIIKLENYPYMEYGSVKGVISSISLTSNIIKSDNGDVNAYLVNVDLPEDLKTNYGSKLDFGFEIGGTGEIITQNRRLIQRIFDNLNYIKNEQ